MNAKDVNGSWRLQNSNAKVFSGKYVVVSVNRVRQLAVPINAYVVIALKSSSALCCYHSDPELASHNVCL